MKKGKKEERIDFLNLVSDLYSLRKERKEIEAKEKKVSELLILNTAPGILFRLPADGETYEVRHETAETPVMNPDMNWIRKKVGKLFDKIIRISVADVRAEGGQALIDVLKIGENTSHSIKFYKVKED